MYKHTHTTFTMVYHNHNGFMSISLWSMEVPPVWGSAFEASVSRRGNSRILRSVWTATAATARSGGAAGPEMGHISSDGLGRLRCGRVFCGHGLLKKKKGYGNHSWHRVSERGPVT